MRRWLGRLACLVGWHNLRFTDKPRAIHRVGRFVCRRCGAEVYTALV